MFCYFKAVATIAVVILATVFPSRADFFKATFMTRKTVATSYLTIQSFSKVQCVDRCCREGREGRCSIAGYNKATKSCLLSMDSQQDVVDSTDVSNGVFIIQQEPLVTTQGNKTELLHNSDVFIYFKHIIILYTSYNMKKYTTTDICHKVMLQIKSPNNSIALKYMYILY